jgi:hypothetical protein
MDGPRTCPLRNESMRRLRRYHKAQYSPDSGCIQREPRIYHISMDTILFLETVVRSHNYSAHREIALANLGVTRSLIQYFTFPYDTTLSPALLSRATYSLSEGITVSTPETCPKRAWGVLLLYGPILFLENIVYSSIVLHERGTSPIASAISIFSPLLISPLIP